ncbi:MAG TPA: gamma carbonic anhydrase family protein [Syntrophorhabdaceae bacterium]|nr:gamma carbonic anhydrase family protein [Syntrophorhabdaceae bacterium]
MFYEYDEKVPVIGDETYVSETAIIIGNVHIGNNCYIGHGAILRGDYGGIEIGDKTIIEEGVIIHAPPDERCSIRDGVVIGHGAVVHAKFIGENAGIGMGAILSVRSEIGDGTVIAEGAVIKQNQVIAPEIMVAGNPARKMRDITEKDQDFWAYSRQLYIDLAKKYLAIGMRRIERNQISQRKAES